jgi:hypothetical protein
MSRALDRGQQPIAPGALGTGTPGSGNFLRGDGSWEAVPSADIASTAEAQAGTNNTNFITPLRMREGFNAGGSAPVYACRAWVNFDGISSASIRASGNVSSVSRNGTGDYTVNFTTALPDANYAALGTTEGLAGDGFPIVVEMNRHFGTASAPTTTSVRLFVVVSGSNTLRDTSNVYVSIFR